MVDNYKLTCYWVNKQIGGERKWSSLYHNGVLFPPKYKKHDVPVIFNGEEIVLEDSAEEFATIYAKYIETEYYKSKVFNKNFWNDWKKVLGKEHKITSLEGCNFTKIYNHILNENMKRKSEISKELKDALKKEEEKYTIANMDNKQQKVSNYKIEPPGIFLGRGCNPKLGKLKHRIYPKDVTLNLSKDAPVPMPTRIYIADNKVITEQMTDHKWGRIIHDSSVEWLASWKDDITNKTKYVWLGAQSELKSKSDIHKFDLARKLKQKIKTIRDENNNNLKSSDIHMRQIATALYFIDTLALRVGNEKGDDETDTVGVTSLRVEHIKLLENNQVSLDFHGKDYVRYVNTVEVTPQVYENLKEFTTNKTDDQLIFDKISTIDVNHYLQTFMKGLTAKVFRTYNASSLFQKELSKINKKYDTYENDDKINKLLDEFNMANAKVAILCNHQRNISKSFNDQLVKLNEMIKKTKTKIKDTKNKDKQKILKQRLELLKTKKSLKIQLKSISLGTSKVNYIDPRISVAFMKRYNIPFEKVFSKALIEKFNWAITDTDTNFTF